MFKTRTLRLLGGAFLSALIAPLAVAQEGEPRGQITENPLVPANEATHNAYLGPRAGADGGGLVDGAAWFIADIQTLEISWTIEHTGEANVTSAAIMCPAEGAAAAAPGDDPIGVSVEGMTEVIPISIDASTEGVLEGTSPNISEAIFTQIVNGACVLSLSTADVEHALTGRI